MKKSYILLCALAALAAASCTEKEELAPSFTGEKVTREFSTVLTKTTLHTDGATVYWEEGDAISIFDGVSNNQFDIQGYDNGSPSASATFSGTVDAGATSFYAVYPYAAGNAFAGSTLTAEVPAAQTLKAGSFQSGAAVAVAYTTGNSLAFHQATAILGITLDSDMNDVESIEFYGNNDEYIAGAVDVAMNTSNGAITSVTPGTGSKKVTLTGTFEAGATYYLSFIPQTFTGGVTVLVNFDGDKTGIVTSSKSLTTEAGMSYPIANFTRVTLPKATFAAKNSFNYDSGAAQNLAPESYANIASITVDSYPAGWDIAWDTDHFEVTTPTQAEIQATPQTVVPEGTFEVTLRSAAGHTRQVEIPVRLYGINNVDDLLAFRDLHGATGTLNASAISALSTSCADYLVGESLMLNADITLARSTMYSAIPAYFIHHLYVPLNGNNRTITADYKSSLAVCALFQYVHGDVSNLNIAGTFESEYPSGVAHLASLAHYASKDGIVIDNVNSSATLKYNSGNGGNIGGIIVRVVNDCAATISNCTFNGTINAYNGVDKMGGIISHGTLDTGAKRTDVDKCTFSGTINYSSTTHSNSRIGGIMGSNERNGQITKSTSSGDININLYGTTMVNADSRGVGGILGRCNKTQSGYTVETTVTDCTFSGTITVTNGPSENSTYYNKIIGSDLRPATQSGNDGSLGTINLSGAVAGALSFDDASTVSFAYGETKVFDVTASGSVSGVDMSSIPAGWTVDCSAWSTGKVSVTAPGRDAIVGNTAVGIGNVVLNATLTDASVVAADNAKSVRLYGINSKEEFNSFKSIYGATADTPTTTGLDDYLVDGVLTLNTNLSFSTSTSGDFQSTAYVLKYLTIPLDGNNKTITGSITTATAVTGFCQGIKANVSNLNFDGTWVSSAANAFVGVLAARGTYNTAVILTNVNLSKTAKVGGTGTYSNVGGLLSQYSAGTAKLTLNNCTSNGVITVSNGQYVGGLVANCNKNYPVDFKDCSFNGSITVSNSYGSASVGGFIDIPGSANVSFDSCVYGESGAISATGDYASVAGFIASAGTGSASSVSFVDCNLFGTINIKLTGTTKNRRFGGFIGDNARILEMSNCCYGGEITLDANSLAFTSVAGLLGRTTAQNAKTDDAWTHEMRTEVSGLSITPTASIVITNYVSGSYNRVGVITNGYTTERTVGKTWLIMDDYDFLDTTTGTLTVNGEDK